MVVVCDLLGEWDQLEEPGLGGGDLLGGGIYWGSGVCRGIRWGDVIYGVGGGDLLGEWDPLGGCVWDLLGGRGYICWGSEVGEKGLDPWDRGEGMKDPGIW